MCIACAEAVFLGILLTQGWTSLQRLPLGFKSRGSDGQVRVARHNCVALHSSKPAMRTDTASPASCSACLRSVCGLLLTDDKLGQSPLQHDIIMVLLG